MEMVLFSLVMAWLATRYVVGDIMAAVRGTESPRTRDRAARQQIAQQRGGGPTVGQALSSRLAQRIANPPHREAGPFRNWLAEWWDDMWAEATERRLRARQRRIDRQAELDRQRHEQRRQPPPPPPEDDDTDVIDAEIVEPEPDPDPQPEEEQKPAEPDPPPAPPAPPEQPEQDEPEPPPGGPDLTKKENPVTSPNDLSGETYNPQTASVFALGCQQVADDVIVQIEQSIAALEEKGVSGAPIEHLEQMKESFSVASAHAGEANTYFESHIATRDVVASDDTIAGTQTDGYLDPAAA